MVAGIGKDRLRQRSDFPLFASAFPCMVHKKCTAAKGGRLTVRQASVASTRAEKRHSGLKLEVAHPICNGIIPRVAALMT